ncbi:uncharacterized protein LOC125043079 [Penaeus chinensis]|uniref:uncharacterized protein LOC125043079 n=1 Tax=Penaeus chinensis TaxID=139456 RepID=UPI001FB81A54|nr:uncharacterized protein LOC125043079 [Penaeus chinensis]
MKVIITLAVVFLSLIQLSVNDTPASPCDVTAISVKPVHHQLRVYYNLTLNDEANCPEDRKFLIYSVNKRSSYVNHVNGSKSSSVELKGEGKFWLEWLNSSSKPEVRSADFWMPGNQVNTSYRVLGYRSDMIHFHMVDEYDRVKYAVIGIYKVLVDKMVFIENVTGNSTDVLKENLSPNDCYIFELTPVFWSSKIKYKAELYTDYMRCAIIRQGFPGRPLRLTQPLSDTIKVTIPVVVLLVGLVSAASVVIVRKLSARDAAVLAEDDEARMLSSQATRPELLVIHAREPMYRLHHDYTLRLMDQLRIHCNAKVHDIWDFRDPRWLQDPNGWLQRVLAYTSDVKVLLVMSPRVVSVMNAIVDHRSPRDLVDLEEGSKERGFLQMVSSIRKLLDKDLFDNYDRVYVVRFSSLWDKDEDILSVITGSRRFCLPEHTENLFEEIGFESN